MDEGRRVGGVGRDAEGRFDPEVLDRSVIAVPLLRMLADQQRYRDLVDRVDRNEAEEAELERLREKDLPDRFPVIIDLNLEFHGGREVARNQVVERLEAIGRPDAYNKRKSELTQQYLFATLSGEEIRDLVRWVHTVEPEQQSESPDSQAVIRPIYRIWPDFEIRSLIHKSISTVKADAAQASFAAVGGDIVWAVLDSGIDKEHKHFKVHQNLDLKPPINHLDLTGVDTPLADPFGHGTHVAGIIAGESDPTNLTVIARRRDENGDVVPEKVEVKRMSGMAPRCKLVSIRVLDDAGKGQSSSLIAGIEYVQKMNEYGRRLRIHGVNMSVGYDFEPEWFACGQSPLCVEVDRLVKSGVVVVVAAGNTGYGFTQSKFRGVVAAGMDLTINDPGNAELAITVGSTHRDMPHTYGVSYFSSKGPTGDGRLKPDLVAPGEKILSCAAGGRKKPVTLKDGTVVVPEYIEESGTSMAAPHVSGVIAAFLSIRQEFVGRPEQVKRIFLSTATDLNRERSFQGHGLVDLMRAIQSV